LGGVGGMKRIAENIYEINTYPILNNRRNQKETLLSLLVSKEVKGRNGQARADRLEKKLKKL